MSVTDFECAIAKSQIGRYISGENLAPEIARQLESHINSCARCKQLLQEKKNSLEAMIVDNDDAIQIETKPIPMSKGTSALKPDYMEELAESARRSLRERLADSPRIKTEIIEVPKVASAYAYKDEVETETIRLEIPTDKPAQKRGLNLSALALFKNVPDENAKPAMTIDNIRAAKAVIRDNNSSMKKPVMYLAGLCTVVAAMSFVLRDPTTLFGGKASEKTAKVTAAPTAVKKTAKKPVTKIAKVLPHKPTQLNDKGTDAQVFTTEPAPTSKQTAKKIVKSVPHAPVTQKVPVAKKVTPKLVRHAVTKPVKAKVQAQKFAAQVKPKAKSRSHAAATKKKTISHTQESTVKLYTPDSTPQSQEQK
jgi:hypothetical protein